MESSHSFHCSKELWNVEIRISDSCCCHPPGYFGPAQHASLSATWIFLGDRWHRLDLVGDRRHLLRDVFANAGEFSEGEAIELLSDCLEE